MALHLARRKQRLPSNPSLIQLFSTSSSDPPPQEDSASGENSSQSPSSSSSPNLFASYFSDVKASLKQRSPQQQNARRPFPRSDAKTQNPASFTFSGNQSGTSILEAKKNLFEFRRRNAVPPPGDSGGPPSQSQPQFSFQEHYKRNVASSSGFSSVDPGPRTLEGMSFSAIRESLQQISSREKATNRTENKGKSLSGFQNILNMKPNHNVTSNVIGGAEAYSLPISVFGKEMEERKAEKQKEGETEEVKTDFVKSYTADELGEKLKLLRPGGKKEEGWFSLQELNERLIKLRQWEENHAKNTKNGFNIMDLRAGMEKWRKHEEAKKKVLFQGLDLFSQLDGSPPFMLHPPKEHLLDTYFHPDNMSSAEKMKLELAKVREEFKLSESDCGSSLVQVAQLTIKIKHLSSVLHKKDKHSRKGLLAMVQRRKKILKYMRRKDWDNYCIALSKLGLRDNPDYKN